MSGAIEFLIDACAAWFKMDLYVRGYDNGYFAAKKEMQEFLDKKMCKKN